MTDDRLLHILVELHESHGIVESSMTYQRIESLFERAEALAMANERQWEGAAMAARGTAMAVEGLTAEIAKLRAENAAMREIVSIVTDTVDDYDRCRIGRCEPVWREHFSEWRHAPDCPVTKVRGLLDTTAST